MNVAAARIHMPPVRVYLAQVLPQHGRALKVVQHVADVDAAGLLQLEFGTGSQQSWPANDFIDRLEACCTAQ